MSERNYLNKISTDNTKFAFRSSHNVSERTQVISIKSRNGNTISTDASFTMYSNGCWNVNSDCSMIAYNHDPANNDAHPHVIRVYKLNESGSYDQLADLERPNGWTYDGDSSGIWKFVKILSDTKIVVGTSRTNTTNVPQLHLFELTNNSWSLSGTFTLSGSYLRIYTANLYMNNDGTKIASRDGNDSTKLEFFELDYDNFTTSSFAPNFTLSGSYLFAVNENLNTILNSVDQGTVGLKYLKIHKYNSSNNLWEQTNGGNYIHDTTIKSFRAAFSHDGNVFAVNDKDNQKIISYYYDHENDEWKKLGSDIGGMTNHSVNIIMNADGDKIVTINNGAIYEINFTKIYY